LKRAELEHVIRAAATIADDDEIVVLGSQAILGQFPDAPEELLRSMEADVHPRNRTERWDLIDGSIGALSPFHDTYGYYAQGVPPGTAILPAGWEARTIVVSGPGTRGATGLCLEVHDLLISKLVAGRDKDIAFATAAARHRLATRDTLLERLSDRARRRAPRAGPRPHRSRIRARQRVNPHAERRSLTRSGAKGRRPHPALSQHSARNANGLTPMTRHRPAYLRVDGRLHAAKPRAERAGPDRPFARMESACLASHSSLWSPPSSSQGARTRRSPAAPSSWRTPPP
jgi:hypothetical protein